MSDSASHEISLFSDEDLKQVRPTGSPWEITCNDPATVPVPLQTVIVNVEGPYTERDRKLWVFLLHAVFDKLGEKQIHSLSVHEINKVFRECGGDHGTKWLWESAKRLAKTTVEWESTFEDERFAKGVSAMFSAVLSKEARAAGTLHFHFPPFLIPIIKTPQRFARLRVHFLLQLSGKYAVTLYEILEGFANRRDGRCEVTLDDLRVWLKVPPGSYKTYKDFRKWVLDPAIKQINNNPEGAGFTVAYTPVRDGKFYRDIIFTLNKTVMRGRKEESIRFKNKLAKSGRGELFMPFKFEEMGREIAREKNLDFEYLMAEYRQWISGKPEPKKGYGPAFVGFCKKKKSER